MPKNILIIGGSYFAGRVFVEKLAGAGGYSVHVLNRGNAPLNMEGVEEIVCDRHSPNLKSCIPDLEWDAVVDFCAYAPLDIVQTIVALPRGRVRQYILISTASIYEPSRDLPIKEDAPKLQAPQPELGPAADYGYNKWQAELKLMELAEHAGMTYTSLRPAIIYGKYNYAPRESYFFDLIRAGQTIILPDSDLALFQFVSVWDAADIILKSIGNEKTFNQAFNLAAEELISYRRLVEVLEEITGREIPTRTMDIPSINRERIPLPFPLDEHLIYSGAKIQRALDFEYTPFPEGLKMTYDFYIQNTT